MNVVNVTMELPSAFLLKYQSGCTKSRSTLGCTIDNRNTVKGLEMDSLQNCKCVLRYFRIISPYFTTTRVKTEFQYCQSKLTIEGKVESYLALPDST